MNKLKNTSRYIIFGLCVTCIIILLAILLFIYINGANKDTLAQDQSIYKTDFCDGKCTIGKTVKNITTSYTCEICKKKFSSKTTNVPKLCTHCAKSTGKCSYCGNFLIHTSSSKTKNKFLKAM